MATFLTMAELFAEIYYHRKLAEGHDIWLCGNV